MLRPLRFGEVGKEQQAVKWAFFAAAAVVVLQVPCDARGPARSVIIANRALGVRISKPPGWHTLTEREQAENLEDLPPNLRAALASYANAPKIAFTKFAEPYNNVNPSLVIRAGQANKLAGETASYILSRTLAPAIAAVDGQLAVNIRDAKVGGRPAAYARIDYLLRADGKAFPTASEIWVVPRGRYFLLIGAGTRVIRRTEPALKFIGLSKASASSVERRAI